MTLKSRIDALIQLGKELTPDNEQLQATVRRTQAQNSWLTESNQWQAIDAVRSFFLDKHCLETWLGAYQIPDTPPNGMKQVSLVLAGNIPLVGFHDVLCVFVSGHRSKIKVSDKDPFLIPFVVQTLMDINPEAADYFTIVDGRMGDFDAVIATGSNNSARYFEAYFGKYPHIIRKNRNAVAILSGKTISDSEGETDADFRLLGADIFTYFGLGCRNVSKLYLPRAYNFEPLLEILHENKELVLHDKYKNNFDYQFTLSILNKVPYQSNGCILLIESTAIASPIAMVFYEYYDDYDQLTAQLLSQADEIQCVVARKPVEGLPSFYFGEAQKPQLSDYADGVDTLAFLISL